MPKDAPGLCEVTIVKRMQRRQPDPSAVARITIRHQLRFWRALHGVNPVMVFAGCMNPVA